VPAELLTADARLLDPEYDSRPTELCQKLSRGEAMVAERTAFGITVGAAYGSV